MKYSPETLQKIFENGRLAADAGQSPAANPYFNDMHNERLDAWLDGYKSFRPDEGTASTPSRRSFRMTPKGVGLRTMIRARDEGWVEIDIGLKPPRARLTHEGKAAREALSLVTASSLAVR